MSFPPSSAEPDQAVHRMPPRPRTLGFALSIVMLAIYCGFILLVAYAKPFLGSTITPGLSWGILLGATVIVVAWLLTLIYVVVSNRPATRP